MSLRPQNNQGQLGAAPSEALIEIKAGADGACEPETCNRLPGTPPLHRADLESGPMYTALGMVLEVA